MIPLSISRCLKIASTFRVSNSAIAIARCIARPRRISSSSYQFLDQNSRVCIYVSVMRDFGATRDDRGLIASLFVNHLGTTLSSCFATSNARDGRLVRSCTNETLRDRLITGSGMFACKMRVHASCASNCPFTCHELEGRRRRVRRDWPP